LTKIHKIGVLGRSLIPSKKIDKYFQGPFDTLDAMKMFVCTFSRNWYHLQQPRQCPAVLYLD